MSLSHRVLGLGLLCSMMVAPVLADTPTSTTGKTAKPLVSKHQAVSDTITALERAKKMLEADKSKDVNNHKANATADIMKAMQELRDITQGAKH